ncbi:MAG TPA: NADP-dependent oxidoreductase [Pyrinomonadaceae bacterium]|nr:NADP-dependent oxidoreductase [Pyrinomonadaceae bacterium]
MEVQRAKEVTRTRSARIHGYGGPEVVQVEEAALPNPQAGEVLIRISAAGVNPIDWKLRSGHVQKAMPLPMPSTLGGDFSGVVEAVGADVNNLKQGDEVYGQAGVLNGGTGTFAEFCVAKAGTIAPKPKALDHLEAGALPLVGVSAVQTLTEHMKLQSGEKILIHGGAGGIGSIAVQIAKKIGAHVVTTAAAEDIDYVKSLGADEVIDYKSRKFEDATSDLDGVFDTVGGDAYRRSFAVLKRGGRIVSMLEKPDEALMKEHGVEAISQFTKVNTEHLTKLTEFIEQGAVGVHIDKTFPLDQAADALAFLEKESPRGKVVIQVV